MPECTADPQPRQEVSRRFLAATSAETMPVGTAMTLYPTIISIAARTWPGAVDGAMSPKPTVLMVTMDQYTPRNIESNPCSGPSIKYIVEPTITFNYLARA